MGAGWWSLYADFEFPTILCNDRMKTCAPGGFANGGGKFGGVVVYQYFG